MDKRFVFAKIRRSIGSNTLYMGMYLLVFVVLVMVQSSAMQVARISTALSGYLIVFVALCGPLMMTLSGNFWRSGSVGCNHKGFRSVAHKTFDTYLYFLQVETTSGVILFFEGWVCGYSLIRILTIVIYVIGFLSLTVVPLFMDKLRAEHLVVAEWKYPRCLFLLAYGLLFFSVLFPFLLVSYGNQEQFPLIILFAMGALGIPLGPVFIRGLLSMFVAH